MGEDVYMLEQPENLLLSLDASAIGTVIVGVPESVGMRAVNIIADSADQAAAEATFDLCNTSQGR